MNAMNISEVEPKFWKNKKVLITGHTGFKGSWLANTLHMLGADVTTYSTHTSYEPSLFYLLNLDKKIPSTIGNINDRANLASHLKKVSPDIVFHLAAQPLVVPSYNDPIETFQTNILGLQNLLEECRSLQNLQAVFVITTDKVYKNIETFLGYKETDPLGGNDPYSSSKACAEIVTHSYAQSFFKNSVKIATFRAGNIIGGGDFSDYRLVPDIIKSIFSQKKILIRNPSAIRPWQHVLDCIRGYILGAQHMLISSSNYYDTWNIGPDPTHKYTVLDVMLLFKKYLDFEYETENLGKVVYKEAKLLSLDSNKAFEDFGWKQRISIEQAVELTSEWYLKYLNRKSSPSSMLDIFERQIDAFVISK